MTTIPDPTRKTTLYIDADACPVKAEAEKVARRYAIPMVLVCNGGIRPSAEPLVSIVIVNEGPDAADRWIAEHCGKNDVVVTADLPLADRCIKAGALVLSHTGEILDRTNIGNRLAMRDLMSDIRAADPFHRAKGSAFSSTDRSRFLQSLDRALKAATRMQ